MPEEDVRVAEPERVQDGERQHPAEERRRLAALGAAQRAQPEVPEVLVGRGDDRERITRRAVG